MIEIGPNMLVAIQATCGVIGGIAFLFFCYMLVRDN